MLSKIKIDKGVLKTSKDNLNAFLQSLIKIYFAYCIPT